MKKGHSESSAESIEEAHSNVYGNKSSFAMNVLAEEM